MSQNQYIGAVNINRKEKRELVKKIGKTRADILYKMSKTDIPQNDIVVGDKVRLNVGSILHDSKSLTEKFKKWVEDNKDTVFTAEQHKEGNAIMFTLEEDTSEIKWVFWYGHLIRVPEEGYEIQSTSE